MTVRILTGDCRELLATLPAESVHCCITSPPYFGLRDYGVAGQIGLEADPDEWVAELVAVFREVRRVLRKDGTLWLNLGDAYCHGTGVDRGPSTTQGSRVPAGWSNRSQAQRIRPSAGIKPKDMIGSPWLAAFALRADGWYLRQDIVWSKPNPMPESVTDRCTKAHEYMFLLSKSPRYFYDADAIAEGLADSSVERLSQPGLAEQRGSDRVPGKTNGPMKAVARSRGVPPRHAGYESSDQSGLDEVPRGRRNKRSVWTIATQPFSQAHFATFPPALVEPCVLAATSQQGCCATCGAPRRRVTEREFVPQADVNQVDGVRGAADQKPLDASNGWQGVPRGTTQSTTTGWVASCTCNAETAPCTVLDPFGGAGTTGLVADRLQRDAILIELNPEYADMARRRIAGDSPLFTEVA